MNEPIITEVQETPLKNSDGREERKNLKKINYKIGTIVLIFIVIAFIPISYCVWYFILSPEAQQAQGVRAAYDYYSRVQNNFAADTYGGKTPEETIQLFTKALEEDNLELAAKYMRRDKNGKEDPRYLETLKSLTTEQKQAFLFKLKSVKVDSNDDGSNGYSARFSTLDKDGHANFSINLYNGHYTPVWKIDNM